jgi:hypothetical protein
MTADQARDAAEALLALADYVDALNGERSA